MENFNFETGNGWILSAIILVISYGPVIFGKDGGKRLVDYTFASPKGKWCSIMISVILIFLAVYPLFFEIRFGTPLFFTGFVLFIIACTTAVVSFVNYLTTPMDRPILKGIYKISRNPIYVSMTLMFTATACMLHSMVMALIAVVSFGFQHFIILEEEQFCERRYGKAYLEYKNRVPRYFII